jgi:large subunit ribosomal protein L5
MSENESVQSPAEVSSSDNKNSESQMKKIMIEKLTLNFCAGTNQKLLDKGFKLIQMISGKTPVKTVSNKRIPSWGLRPGLPIGCKITLRGKEANEMLSKLLEGIDKTLKEKSFDSQGNFSFGLKEYIDVPSLKYDPDIGIIGFEAAVTLYRKGYRVMRRKGMKTKISKTHRISAEEAKNFVRSNFGAKVGEEA